MRVQNPLPVFILNHPIFPYLFNRIESFERIRLEGHLRDLALSAVYTNCPVCSAVRQPFVSNGAFVAMFPACPPCSTHPIAIRHQAEIGRLLIAREKVHIYVLVDPRDQTVRYLGKTKYPLITRLRQHVNASNANNNSSVRRHVYYWIRQLIKLGLVPIIRLVETTESYNWQQRERYWIAQFREQGLRLTNGTDGGDGLSGTRFTDEHRQKISAALKGKTKTESHRAKVREAIVERYRDPVYRAKVVSALKISHLNPERKYGSTAGRHPSEETRAKLSTAMRRRMSSEETKRQIGQAVSRALKGRKVSEETRRKLSVAKRGKPLTEKQLDALRATGLKRRGFRHTEESKEKMRNAARSTWSKRKTRTHEE